MSQGDARELERADYELVVALPGPIDLEQRIRAAGLTPKRLIDDVISIDDAASVPWIELVPLEEPGGFGPDRGRLTATDLVALSASRHGLFVSAGLGDDPRRGAQAVVAALAAIAPELIAIEDTGTWTSRSGRWAHDLREGRELTYDELFDIHTAHDGAGRRFHTHGLARIAGLELALVADTDDPDVLEVAHRLLAHVALAAAVGALPPEGEPFAIAEDLAVRWEWEPAGEDEDDGDDVDGHPTALVVETAAGASPVGFDAVTVDGWYVPRLVDDLNGRQARRTLAGARAAAAETGAQLLVYRRGAGVVDDAPDVDPASLSDWQLALPSGMRLGPFAAHDLGVLADLEAGAAGVARVWTGLCEVIEVGDSGALEGGEGAFVTAIALASSRDEFASIATAALVGHGVLVVEIDDLASFAVDFAAAIDTDNAEYDDLVRSVALDGGVEVGPFHIWGPDDD